MITFHSALPSDHNKLTAICKASKSYWGYPEAWLEMWKPDLTITPDYILEHQVIKVINQDRLVGFFSLEKHETHVQLEHLWFVPSEIGKGLGKLTLAHIFDNLTKKEDLLYVISDPNAQEFYERQGFVLIEKIKSKVTDRLLPRMLKKWSASRTK